MEVRVIPARKTDENLQPKKLRVAAYCRVSSDLGSQDGSIESQKKPSDMFRKDWVIISVVEVADPAGRISWSNHRKYT